MSTMQTVSLSTIISAVLVLVLACMSSPSSTVDAFSAVPNLGVSSGRVTGRARLDQLSMVQSIPTKGFRFPQTPNNESFQSSSPVVPARIQTDVGSVAKQMVRAVRKELCETYNLLESNLMAHVSLGMLGGVIPSMIAVAQLKGGMGIDQCASILAKSLVWFFWYGYIVDIENQTDGVEEDKLNPLPTKQKRPLVTGAWTIAGAKKRIWISRVAYTGVSALIGGMPLTLCALAWIATTSSMRCSKGPLWVSVKNKA